MDITLEIIGWSGTSLLILAYALVSAKRNPPGMTYQALNALGALGLIINGAAHSAWPSVGLNTVWLGIAIVVITGRILRPNVETAARPSGE